MAAMALLCVSGPALAEDGWKDKVDVDARLTLQYIAEEDTDLGTTAENGSDSFSQQLQLLTGVDFTENWFGFFHGRALNIDGESGFDDDTGNSISANQSFFELRELYVEKKNLFNVLPLSLQVGRQRIREPRALWWNSDNDAVRLNYNSSLLNGFVAVSENLSSYRSNTDSDFRQDDEDRLRFLGEGSWQYRYNHFLEGRLLFEDDHSGVEAPGTIVNVANRDIEDQELAWAGIRATGSFLNMPAAHMLKYRADLIGVYGEETNITSVAGPGTDQRTVTGSMDRDVRAWAFDGGAIVDPASEGGAVFTLGYAFGSGDDSAGTGTNHEFRQTDMQGSSSRIGLERQQQRNYGEVLRPELSNLHVLSAGGAYPVSDATDVSLTYFYYHLDEDATSLRSSGVSAPLNGTDKSVGQGLDFIVNVNVGEQFDVDLPFAKRTDFRFVAGSFFPGDAYEPGASEDAYRLFSEIRFRF